MLKIKAPPGKVKVDIKEGWYHVKCQKTLERKKMTVHECPDFYVDNEGRFTNPIWVEWMVNKHKVYPSVETIL